MIKKWVKVGTLAGLVAGIIVAVAVYSSLPTPDEVIAEINASGALPPGTDIEDLRGVVEASLQISGVVSALFTIAVAALSSLIGGAVAKAGMGGLMGVASSALVFALILVAPNLAAHAGVGKVMMNVLALTAFTAVMAIALLGGLLEAGREAEERAT